MMTSITFRMMDVPQPVQPEFVRNKISTARLPVDVVTGSMRVLDQRLVMTGIWLMEMVVAQPAKKRQHTPAQRWQKLRAHVHQARSAGMDNSRALRSAMIAIQMMEMVVAHHAKSKLVSNAMIP